MLKISKNKKAVGLSLLAIFMLFALITFLITFGGSSTINISIGKNAEAILEANQNAEEVTFYLDQALRISAKRVVGHLDYNQGETNCGEQVYPIYLTNNKETCIPNFQTLFKKQLDYLFKGYLAKFGRESFYDFSFFFELSQKYEGDGLNTDPILFINLIPISQPNIKILGRNVEKTKTMNTVQIIEQKYPSGPMGTCGQEKIEDCKNNDCFSKVAQYLYNTYIYSNIKINYISGGMSPYSYHDSIEGGKCSKIFEGNYPTKYNDDQQLITTPGFDSAGWLWWVGKHANISQLGNEKKSISQYYDSFKQLTSTNHKFVWELKENPLTPEQLSNVAQPGDVIFISKNDVVNDAMIYIGNNKAIYLDRSNGLVAQTIPLITYSNIYSICRYLPVLIIDDESTPSIQPQIISTGVQYSSQGGDIPGVEFIQVPDSNYNLRKPTDKVKYLIIHYTAGDSINSAKQAFLTPNGQSSAQYILGDEADDFKTLQMVLEKDAAFHAGCYAAHSTNGQLPQNINRVCSKPDYNRINYDSIGIEVVNLGYDCPKFNKQTCQCTSDDRCWEPYPDEQFNRLVALSALIVKRNNIVLDRTHILGHDEIVPKHKVDPGPLFNWDKFMDEVRVAVQKQEDDLIAIINGDEELPVEQSTNTETPPTTQTPNNYVMSDTGNFVLDNSPNYNEDLICNLYFDSSAWKESEAGKYGSFQTFNNLLMEYDLKNKNELFESISRASTKYSIPEEVIKAIMYAEVGGEEIKNYLKDTKCSPGKGICGLMQVSVGACSDINKYTSYKCDWESLSKGTNTILDDVEMTYRQAGIEAGTAYLLRIGNILVNKKYMTWDKPNYYFLGIAYNAGTGKLDSLLDVASKRLDRPIETIYFSDLIKADFEVVWAGNDKKIIETWRYGHLVGKALSSQCVADPMAIYFKNEDYTQNKIQINGEYSTSISFDINKYEVIPKFINFLSQECLLLNQNECISKAISKYSTPDANITLISDYSISDPNDPAIKEDSLIASFTDQVIDCQKNEQAECICPIKIDPNRMNSNIELFQFTWDLDGNYLVQPLALASNGGITYADKKIPNHLLGFKPQYVDSSGEMNNIDSILFKFKKENNILNAAYMQFKNAPEKKVISEQVTISSYNTFRWSTASKLFALYKNDSKNLGWYYYEDLKTDPLVCYPNKKYQRFKINFKDGQSVSFTAYVEDFIPANWSKFEITLDNLQTLNCINSNVVKLSWKVDDLNERLYSFNLHMAEETPTQKDYLKLFLQEQEPIEIDPSKVLLNKLYYNSTSQTYSVYTDGYGDLKFEENKQYVIMITTTDEFNNTNKIDEGQINPVTAKIQPNLIKSQISSGLLQMGLDQTYVDETLNTYCDSDLSSLTEDLSSILNSGSCCKRYEKEVKLSEPKIVN